MLELTATLARLDDPDPEVRSENARLIARAIPALNVKHGQIVG